MFFDTKRSPRLWDEVVGLQKKQGRVQPTGLAFTMTDAHARARARTHANSRIEKENGGCTPADSSHSADRVVTLSQPEKAAMRKHIVSCLVHAVSHASSTKKKRSNEIRVRRLREEK